MFFWRNRHNPVQAAKELFAVPVLTQDQATECVSPNRPWANPNLLELVAGFNGFLLITAIQTAEQPNAEVGIADDVAQSAADSLNRAATLVKALAQGNRLSRGDMGFIHSLAANPDKKYPGFFTRIADQLKAFADKHRDFLENDLKKCDPSLLEAMIAEEAPASYGDPDTRYFHGYIASREAEVACMHKRAEYMPLLQQRFDETVGKALAQGRGR